MEKEHAIFPLRRHAVLPFITRLHVFFFFWWLCYCRSSEHRFDKIVFVQESVDNKNEENGREEEKKSELMNAPKRHLRDFLFRF